jgi:hypothetical protein
MARFAEELEEIAGEDVGRRKNEQTPERSATAKVSPEMGRGRMSRASVLAMQRSVGNAGTAAALQREEEKGGSRSPVHDVIGSGGTALDEDTRETMESHLGTGLSDVRLHVDRKSAESVQAAAYTVGNDVVLHPDHFTPGTPAAQRTLAHELTHVVQQRSGPVAGTPREGGIKVSDPSDSFEQEAESSATAFMSAQRLQAPAAGGSAVQRATASVQREEEGEDETEVQELPLQRATASVQR